MNKTASTRLIGLFVLVALALTVALTLTFGGGSYFSKVRKYAVYFEGSVTGLNNGAAVRLKGVGIGRVTDILVQYDIKNNRVLTPVIIEVDLNKVMETYANKPTQHYHPEIKELIDLGLRARLSMQSLVTGQLYVDLNFLPQQPVKLTGAQLLGLPEIPTIPSSKEEIEKTLQHVTAEVQNMPLKETVDALHDVLLRTEHLLAKPETSASIDNLNRTLQDLQHLMRHLDSKIEKTAGESQALMTNLNQRIPPLLDSTGKAMNSASATMTTLEGFIEPGSELSSTLREINEAARSLRELTDNLSRNPDSLLFGRKKQDSN